MGGEEVMRRKEGWEGRREEGEGKRRWKREGKPAVIH